MRKAPIPDDRYPAISDLRKKGKKTIPFFAWEYLDSGTGEDAAMLRCENALRNITLVPRFMKGKIEPETQVELFGKIHGMPLGIPPIGYTSMMWPGSEKIFARTAAKYHIPHCLSTVASDTPEKCGPAADGYGWFQLYPPRREDIRTDLLKRAKDSGYNTLVVTADVPSISMRERQRRAGITIPPKITPTVLYRIAVRPKWALATLKRGAPSFSTMEKYVGNMGAGAFNNIVDFVGSELGGVLDWEYLKIVRDLWDGPLVLKGILSVEDAKDAVKAGVDAVWVSSHGGRQFDGAPASIEVLPEIAEAVGKKTKILFDSGIRSGADILKAIALGADFVFAGRPFLYGVSALADRGGDYVVELLSADMINNMHQLGIERPEQVRDIEVRYSDN